MKNKLQVTLAGLLLATGLNAVELPFDGYDPEIQEEIWESKQNYCIPNYQVTSESMLGIGIPFNITNLKRIEDCNEKVKEGDLICSKEVIVLLYSLAEYNDYGRKGAYYFETEYNEDKKEQQIRAVNKFLRNDNDYIGWNKDVKSGFIYNYAKEFNLLEKLKLDIPIKDVLEIFEYLFKDWDKDKREQQARTQTIEEVYRFLEKKAKSNDTTKMVVGYGEKKANTTLDDDTLSDLYYDFRDFLKVRVQKEADKEINHTKKIIEEACAPIEKVRKKVDVKRGYSVTYITFDENKVKLLKDLDPAHVLKFRETK